MRVQRVTTVHLSISMYILMGNLHEFVNDINSVGFGEPDKSHSPPFDL